jgi:hypothetical protein
MHCLVALGVRGLVVDNVLDLPGSGRPTASSHLQDILPRHGRRDRIECPPSLPMNQWEPDSCGIRQSRLELEIGLAGRVARLGRSRLVLPVDGQTLFTFPR